MPTCESQSIPVVQVPLVTQAPPLHSSVTFWALPLHASAPDDEHAQPRTATAPVPLGEHGLPSVVASCGPESVAASLPLPDPESVPLLELESTPLLDPELLPLLEPEPSVV
jgi:hypothetical protein